MSSPVGNYLYQKRAKANSNKKKTVLYINISVTHFDSLYAKIMLWLVEEDLWDCEKCVRSKMQTVCLIMNMFQFNILK